MRRALPVLAVLAALLVPAAAGAAQCPRTTMAEVEAEVMCTVCGTPLALATEAPQAIRQRALIQRLIDRCRSKEEIKDVLVAQLGESVLALPEPEGFKLSAYVVPAVALLLAAISLGLALPRWRRRRSDRDETAPEPSEAAGKRLDADLERYEL